MSVCHNHPKQPWSLSLPSWDVVIDHILCVAHIELTEVSEEFLTSELTLSSIV